MTKRFAAMLLAVFITATPYVGGNIMGAGCSTKLCCCHDSSVSRHMTADTMISSAHGCCCQKTGKQTCSLSPYRHLNIIGWALSPSHCQVMPTNTPATMMISTASVSPEVRFSPDIEDADIQIPSPPIFLSGMSFLC